jgi:hypothetical protein
MKQIKLHIVIAVLLLSFPIENFATPNDVYFIFYATINGKSGHAGIAIDNYKIIIKDYYSENNERISIHDTIKDGTLTYYDLWPVKDDFDAASVDKDYDPKYNKLPAASWENAITIHSLLEKGIPNEEKYPVDGLVKIIASPAKNYEIKGFIENLIAKNRSFNVREFNCADFAEIVIEHLCNCSVDAREYIFFRRSTTPNKLYQKVSALKDIEIIKNGSQKAKGSFTMERLLKRNK